MANNREIPPLTDIAFEALLKFGMLTPDNESLTQVEQCREKRQKLLLQHIADGDAESVKKILALTPALAVTAFGRVTTCSGYTYENVTAIQLAYLLDDDDMCNNVLMPCIGTLSREMITKAFLDLIAKVQEVEVQDEKFSPYDFSELIDAITADETLKTTGKASLSTESALDTFKDYFKPRTIQRGKSNIGKHLLAACEACDQDYEWNEKQLLWARINIIGVLQSRMEKCYEQAFTQGLKDIMKDGKPFKRDVSIQHKTRYADLSYRGTPDAGLQLGRDFYVHMYEGSADFSYVMGAAIEAELEELFDSKEEAMRQFSSALHEIARPFLKHQPW